MDNTPTDEALAEACLEAAIEINGLWVKGVGGLASRLANCPSDDKVAEVIRRHISARVEG